MTRSRSSYSYQQQTAKRHIDASLPECASMIALAEFHLVFVRQGDMLNVLRLSFLGVLEIDHVVTAQSGLYRNLASSALSRHRSP